MANPFAHIELNTSNVQQAKKFYKSLFDWKLADMPQVQYTLIDVGGGIGGGIQLKPVPEAPTAWLPYVRVDNVARTLAKAEKAGAAIVMERTPIDGMGAIGVFIDPAGAMLGVWETAAATVKKAAKKPTARKKSVAKPATSKKTPSKPATAKKVAAKVGIRTPSKVKPKLARKSSAKKQAARRR